MFKDLLFYDSQAGFTDFYSVRNGLLSRLDAGGMTLRPGWTHIVHGFGGGLLCYDAGSGSLQIWRVSVGGFGAPAVLLLDLPNWRRGWTQVVAGHFVKRLATNDFLFYDAGGGIGEFYTFDAQQRTLSLARRHTGWRTSWRHIVSGSFAATDTTDLVFYDASGGVGEFYAVAGADIRMMKTYSGWRASWTLISPVDFSFNASYTALLFYDAAGRTGEFYSGKHANMSRLKTYTNWRDSWKVIVAGHFGGDTDVVILFYDALGGTGEFYRFDNGQIRLLRTHTGWNRTWTHIVPGNYKFVSGEL